jgi:AAA domain, putative AbiEii toxin, Type IV TA system
MLIPRLFVHSITFNSGQTLFFDKDDIVVFVGANNVGKSATMREIVERGGNRLYNVQGHQIVTSVELFKEGSLEEYQNWANSRFVSQTSSTPPQYFYDGNSIQGDIYGGANWDNLVPNQYGQIPYVSIFWKSLDVMNRFRDQGGSYMMGSQAPNDPIQSMYEDPAKETQVSEWFQNAFGTDLVVNRYGGGSIPLHVGVRPAPEGNQSYFSPEFANEIRSLPLLSSQGNGMRAFVGLLVSCFLDDYKSAIFIDEPEVYLHPPQSRKLGKFLAEKTAKQTQLFMATHDGAFIRGILDAGTQRVRVIRINRDGASNPVHELSNADIQRLWGDTILKYSNVLDGLFHQRVIICESDSDCTLFAAIRDAQGDHEGDDAMFLSAGGKDRVAVLARALSAVGVNVKAALDFDVLNQPLAMTRIAEALGADWNEIEKDYHVVRKSVEEKRPELDKEEVFDKIKRLFDAIEPGAVPKETVSSINGLLRRSNVWSTAKSVGERIIPAGNATQAWQRVYRYCEQNGFHIIASGEIETFVPAIGGHAQKWVNEVLKLDLANDPQLAAARDFVSCLFTEPQSSG